MDESISDGSVVRYYCTAGNGMEPFLIDEVKRKLAAEDVRALLAHETNGQNGSSELHRHFCGFKECDD